MARSDTALAQHLPTATRYEGMKTRAGTEGGTERWAGRTRLERNVYKSVRDIEWMIGKESSKRKLKGPPPAVTDASTKPQKQIQYNTLSCKWRDTARAHRRHTAYRGIEPKGGVDMMLAKELCNVAAEPPESVTVPHLTDDRNHEELDRADIGGRDAPSLSGGKMMQSKRRAQLFLANRARHVNLVSKDEEGHVGKHLVLQQPVQLGLDLRETLAVARVDKEDEPVHLRVVVPPDLARRGMAAQVEGAEADVPDDNLLRRRHLRRHVQGNAVVPQYVH